MCSKKTNKIKKKLVIHHSSDFILLSSLGAAVNSRKFSSSSWLESLDEVLFASAVKKIIRNK